MLFKCRHLLLVLMSLILTPVVFASQYYLVGNDVNDCQLQQHGNYKYVTDPMCMCIQKSEQAPNMEWVNVYGDAQNPSYCKSEPKSLITNTMAHKDWPVNCDKGDGCSQYACLRGLFSDTSNEPLAAVTVERNECIRLTHKHTFKALVTCGPQAKGCQKSI